MIDPGIAVSFGESAAVLASDEREMGVGDGGVVAKGIAELDLAGSGIEEVVTAHDLSDSLVMIVHYDGELITRGLAFGPDDEVADTLRWIDRLRAHERVIKLDRLVCEQESPVGPIVVEL